MSENNDLYERIESADRKERLSAARDPRPASYNPKYSIFIKRLRLILPIIAAILMAVVFAWSNMSDENIIQAQSPQAPKIIGKNELLNPRFESVDKKNQPYTITAARAVQQETNEDLVVLSEPLADIVLESGNWLAVKADAGEYRQDAQKLKLNGNVEMFHDSGYQMTTTEIHVDLEENKARSDTDVYGQGPGGTLNAKGLRADNVKEELIFTGPAKLVLRNVGKGDLEGTFGE